MKKLTLKSVSMVLASLLVLTNSAAMLGSEAAAADGFVSSQPTSAEVVLEDPSSFEPPVDYHTEAQEEVSAVYSPRPYTEASSLPAYYSSYDEGYVTGVGYQKTDPVCWLFAGVSMMETAIMKSGLGTNIDLSEEQLKCSMLTRLANGKSNPYGTRNGFSEGGNFDVFTDAVMRGISPVIEGGEKYGEGYRYGPEKANTYVFEDNTSLPSVEQTVLVPDYNIRKTHWINDWGTLEPGSNGSLITITADERKQIVKDMKQAIYDYGSVICSINATPLKENSTCFLCCTGVTASNLSNHSVTVVGWDDSIPKTLFAPNKPNSNGAFLCKNSWSEKWGKVETPAYSNLKFNVEWPDGYFWLSYEDINCGSYVAAICEVEETDQNQVVYQHDKYMPGNYIYSGAPTGKYMIAVKHKLTSPVERLDSVTFVSQNTGIDYKVWMAAYDGTVSNDTSYLATCDKLLLCEGETDNCGYYTIDIPASAPLLTEDTFYVIVETSDTYPFCTESSPSGVEGPKGVNFEYSFRTNTWSDAEDQNGSSDAPSIKVRTSRIDDALIVPMTLVGSIGNSRCATVTVTPEGQEPLTFDAPSTKLSEDVIFLSDEIPEGTTIDIEITKPGYTSYTIENFVVGQSDIPSGVVLYAGDFNGDGRIYSGDFSKLVNAYPAILDQQADPEFYENYWYYDLNEDGRIFTGDFSKLVTSYNRYFQDHN